MSGPRRAAASCVEQRAALSVAGPLNAAGLCALVFLDHDVDPDAAERSFWSLKIDIALREALAARRAGVAAIPFGGVRYVYEGELPAPRRRDRRELMRRLGLEPERCVNGAAPGVTASTAATAPAGLAR